MGTMEAERNLAQGITQDHMETMAQGCERPHDNI